LIVTDPRSDKQAIIEASYMNIPCIALCDSDSPLEYVDVCIPCNNRSTNSISMIYWLIAREVRILKGELKKDEDWEVFVDLFYYRNVDAELTASQEHEEGDDEDEHPKDDRKGPEGVQANEDDQW